MSKLYRIIENRTLNEKDQPFKALQMKIANAFALERKVGTSENFSDDEKKQATAQFIVYLIACFESYVQDMFRLFVEEDIITLNQVLSIKSLKNRRYNLEELSIIKKHTISISEMIANEMNFQNLDNILEFCTLIQFDYFFYELMKDIKGGNFGFTKEESEEAKKKFIKYTAKNKNEDKEFGKLFSDFVIKNLYRHLDSDDVNKVVGTINLGIKLRHKIVHRAAEASLPYNGFQITLLLCVIQFCAVLQEIYTIKSSSK